MIFLDLANATRFRLTAALTAGAYGAVVSRPLTGRFVVFCTAPIILADGQRALGDLLIADDEKLELPFDPDTSRLTPIQVSSGHVTLAARGMQAAVAWLVPVVGQPFEDQAVPSWP